MLQPLSLKRQCSPLRSHPNPSYKTTPRTRFKRRAHASLLCAALLAGVLTVGAAPATTSAQDAQTSTRSSSTAQLRVSPGLRGPLVYWFTNADRDMSARATLPAPDANGIVSLPVPPDFRQAGALVNVLDTRRGLIARLPVESGMASAEGVPKTPFGPNLLQNGDFAQGAVQWNPELSAGKASGTFGVSPDAPPPGIGGKAARLSIDAIDNEAWHSQFAQYGLSLTQGQPYTLIFWAKANRDRSMTVSATADQSDYHIVGLHQRISLNTQWHRYTCAFTAMGTQKTSRILFVLGDALGAVDLAGVTLQQGVTARPLGDNMLQNATFTAGAAHWITMNQTTPPIGSMQALPTALPFGVEGNVLRLQTTAIGAAPEALQFGQEGLTLEPNALHTLSLWARADKNRAITVQTDKTTGEYSPTGLNAHLALTSEWRHYDLVFTPSDTMNQPQRLVFSVGDSVGNVDLAGLALCQGGMVPAPASAAPVLSADAFTVVYKAVRGEADTDTPRNTAQAHRSHPLIGTWQSFHKDVGLTGKEYQRYRFVFDANGRGMQQVTSLTENVDAPPKSQQNEAFRWQLIEGGPHVSIGANVYTWTIEKDGDRQKLTLKNYEGKTYILFRQ